MSEKHNIQLVLSDVDRTLVMDDRSYPAAPVQAAARALRGNGVSLHTVTSRSRALHHKLVSPLDLRDNLCVLDGGATVAHADSGNVVWSQWLSAETTRSVITSIGQLCTNIHYDMQSRASDPQKVVELAQNNPTAIESAPSVFAIFNTERKQEIIGALAPLPEIQFTRVMNYEDQEALRCIQIVSAGIDKQYGVMQMLAYAKLFDRRILAIGDGMNDFALFDAAGLDGVKVAMGNAPDELKDRADWVAPPVEEHGFAVAMEHYNLI
ncbi:MAG TPA: HAD-IIB family hydrolase [Candidatus Saccharimonadales bacterium]|nr:HAD-IIB family hydrolase [Candidatus Saccharimonadales bacterium]